MRLARLIGPELESLLREDPGEVRELLEEIHPEDIADVVDEFDDEQATELLTELPIDYAAQVFARLDEDRQTTLAERMGIAAAARIATEMHADERADFFSLLPPPQAAQLLERLETFDPEAAEEVEELSRWPDTSAGGLMTTDYWSVQLQGNVFDAVQVIRRGADESEVIDAVYVVDGEHRLAGQLTLRDLVLSEPDVPIEHVMQRNIISVPPELDQEEVARKLAKYDLNALPVVDQGGEMLGIITSDDILDVLDEEQNEDVQKMGAIEPLEDRYFDVSFAVFVRKRAPWLFILFVGGFITTSAMQHYDTVLATVAQLSFYVPLLISAGGNSGAQSSTLIIRGLAVGDIRIRDWWRVLLKESGQGLALGALLAVTGMARVVLVGESASLALLIGATIVGIVVMGCVVGAMMPLLLNRLGLDPATSSTPFIATVVDVLGIIMYLGLAQWLLLDVVAAAGVPP
jgi:magnesium transporter